MSDAPITVIEICLSERDGWFYAYSPSLDELHVCGKSRKAVMRDVFPIIKKLYKLNYNLDVVVRPAAPVTLGQTKPSLKDHLVRLLAFEAAELQAA